MHVDDEFDGDQCVILPTNFMTSVDAAVELYDEDIAQRSTSFQVSGLEYGLGRLLFRLAVISMLFWLLPSYWMHCI
jgi:hypothetical protein